MKKFIPTTGFPNEKATDVKVEVYYDKGGFNPFNCQNEPRGIRLLVIPVRRENGLIHEIVSGGAGRRMLLKTLPRLNAKTLESFEKKADENAEQIARHFEHGDFDGIRNIFSQLN